MASSDRQYSSENVDDVREGTYEAIKIKISEATSRDLDDPNQTCAARKRIFSQSDVEFDYLNERKKINPFSSALSAAPYYFHDFKNNSKEESHPTGAMPTNSNAIPSLLQAKEFHPTGP